MAYEFTKLSDVALTNEPATSANVLVEENGEIKKVPKSAIGAQADWNETDETNPAYILNKPVSLGGYKYYYYYNYYLYKAASATEMPDTVGSTEKAISQAAFENDYYASPIMFNYQGSVIAPCMWYGSYGGTPYVGMKETVGNMIQMTAQNIQWGNATE